MGRPCIVGMQDLYINEIEGSISIAGKVFKEGDTLTLDGASGKVYAGTIPTKMAEISGDFALFMSWADEVRQLKVRNECRYTL